MVSSVFLLLGAVTAWAAYSVIFGLRANLAKARKTNFPCIAVRKCFLILPGPVKQGTPIENTGSSYVGLPQQYTRTIDYGSSHPSCGCPS